ncbi:unannotated protein [freshwater metagenome]|uniref:Unannotated protein n=1 Tax=freshwater metagenome TaxID=449393 RepID=A0A6J6F4C9_9ZZZZ
MAVTAHVTERHQRDDAELTVGETDRVLRVVVDDLVGVPEVRHGLAGSGRLVEAVPDGGAVARPDVVPEQRRVHRHAVAGEPRHSGHTRLAGSWRDRLACDRRVTVECAQVAVGREVIPVDLVAEVDDDAVALVGPQDEGLQLLRPGADRGDVGRQHVCEAVRVVVAVAVVGDVDVDGGDVERLERGTARARHVHLCPREHAVRGRPARRHGEVLHARRRQRHTRRQRHVVVREREQRGRGTDAAGGRLVEDAHDAPRAEPHVLDAHPAVEEVAHPWLVGRGAEAGPALAEAAADRHVVDVEGLGHTDRPGVDERRRRIARVAVPSGAVDREVVLLLVRALDQAVTDVVAPVGVQDRGLGITPHPGTEGVGGVDLLTEHLRRAGRELSQGHRFVPVVDPHAALVTVGSRQRLQRRCDRVGPVLEVGEGERHARLGRDEQRDEVVHRDAELTEVVTGPRTDHVHGGAVRGAHTRRAAHRTPGRVVDRLEPLARLGVTAVEAGGLDDERVEHAAVLHRRGEVVVVQEHRAQLVVGEPALLDGLPLVQPVATGVRRFGSRVVVGGERHGAAGDEVAGPGTGDHLVVEGRLVLGERGLLVVPAVRRSVRGQHVEVDEVDVRSDHVGLDQTLVDVVADVVRGAVGELEVDAVTLVHTEEERLGGLRPGQHRVDVLVGDHDPALQVDPAGVVVGDRQLDDRGAVGDDPSAGGARVHRGRARQRLVLGVDGSTGLVRRIVELPGRVLLLCEPEHDSRRDRVGRVEPRRRRDGDACRARCDHRRGDGGIAGGRCGEGDRPRIGGGPGTGHHRGQVGHGGECVEGLGEPHRGRRVDEVDRRRGLAGEPDTERRHAGRRDDRLGHRRGHGDRRHGAGGRRRDGGGDRRIRPGCGHEGDPPGIGRRAGAGHGDGVDAWHRVEGGGDLCVGAGQAASDEVDRRRGRTGHRERERLDAGVRDERLAEAGREAGADDRPRGVRGGDRQVRGGTPQHELDVPGIRCRSFADDGDGIDGGEQLECRLDVGRRGGEIDGAGGLAGEGEGERTVGRRGDDLLGLFQQRRIERPARHHAHRRRIHGLARGVTDHVAGRVELALPHAVHGLRSPPAVLAGDEPREPGEVDAGRVLRERHVGMHRETRCDEILERDPGVHARAVGQCSGTRLVRVVHPEQRPVPGGEVGVQVAVEDRVADRARTAARPVVEIGREGRPGAVGLGVDGLRTRLALGRRARRDRPGRPTVLRFGRPRVGVQVEHVGLEHTCVPEPDLRRVALVRAIDVGRVARQRPRLRRRVGHHETAVLDVHRRDACGHRQRIESAEVGLHRLPGAGARRQLHRGRVAEHPRRQARLLADAVGTPVGLEGLALVLGLRAVVEREALGSHERTATTGRRERLRAHRDDVLADLHALPVPLAVRHDDRRVQVQVTALTRGCRVLLCRHGRRQLDTRRGLEPTRPRGLHGQAAVEAVFGGATVGIGARRHAHVAEQVEPLGGRSTPEVGDGLADSDRRVGVVADAAAVAAVRGVRHPDGVHRHARIDLRERRSHRCRCELVREVHLDALARVGPEDERTWTHTAACRRVAGVPVRRVPDQRSVPVHDRGLIALQHVQHAVGVAVGEVRGAVRPDLGHTGVVAPAAVGDERVRRRDVVHAAGVGGRALGERGCRRRRWDRSGRRDDDESRQRAGDRQPPGDRTRGGANRRSQATRPHLRERPREQGRDEDGEHDQRTDRGAVAERVLERAHAVMGVVGGTRAVGMVVRVAEHGAAERGQHGHRDGHADRGRQGGSDGLGASGQPEGSSDAGPHPRQHHQHECRRRHQRGHGASHLHRRPEIDSASVDGNLDHRNRERDRDRTTNHPTHRDREQLRPFVSAGGKGMVSDRWVQAL